MCCVLRCVHVVLVPVFVPPGVLLPVAFGAAVAPAPARGTPLRERRGLSAIPRGDGQSQQGTLQQAGQFSRPFE